MKNHQIELDIKKAEDYMDSIHAAIETEAKYIETDDWEGLINYYREKLKEGQKDYIFKISNIYISELKQYQKAIDFLQPYYLENQSISEFKQEIQKAQNYLQNKEIVLRYKDFQLMGEDDLFRLFYDENWNRINNKKFQDNLKELFKKYDYLSVDISNTIFGVKNGKKEFLKHEQDAYSIANDLLEN